LSLYLRAAAPSTVQCRGSIMGSVRNSRSQQLKELQRQLVSVSRMLDKIEARSFCGKAGGLSGPSTDEFSNSTSENCETRFAAYVAFGLSKNRSQSSG
jgi:hypothetical protein